MAEAEIARAAAEAEARWPLLGVDAIHRHGRIEPGEQIVLVAVAAAHRGEAFAAAEMLMDFLKTRGALLEARRRCATERSAAGSRPKRRTSASAARWDAAGR